MDENERAVPGSWIARAFGAEARVKELEAELDQLRELIATAPERIAEKISKLEDIAQEEGGCAHMPDDTPLQCWTCRREMYETAARCVLASGEEKP